MSEYLPVTPEINLTEAREFLLDLLPKAGEILKQYFKSRSLILSKKGPFEIVTEADITVDQYLFGEIGRHYPQTSFLTEETAPLDYSSLKDQENLWIIDPLDGTTNFSRGHPHFAISVALVRRGVSRLGVVYTPMADEIYWAQEDLDSAFLNGEPIKVSSVNDLAEVSFLCDWVPKAETRARMIKWLSRIAPWVRQIRSGGSAVADLSSLATGRVDAYLNPGLKPWDLAAATLIAKKAGAKITNLKGGESDVFNPDVLVTNGFLHEKILSLIREE